MSEAFSLNGANLLRVFYPMIPKVFPNRTPGGKKQSDGQMMDKGWPSEDQVMTKRWSRFCKLWPSLTGFLQVARGAIQGPSGCFHESKIPTLRFSVSLPWELFLPLFPTSPFSLSGCTIIPISVSICPWAQEASSSSKSSASGFKIIFSFLLPHLPHRTHRIFFPRSSDIPFLTSKLGSPTTMFSKSPNSFPFLSSVSSSSPWYPFIASHLESSTFLPLCIFKYMYFSSL